MREFPMVAEQPMTPELAEQYERAAVALESGTEDGNALAFRAFWLAMCMAHDGYEATCNRAARLLRECVAAGKELGE